MPKILTVDDSKATRRMVQRHLKELDLEIQEAQNGDEALEILEHTTFDLILLDVTMPICDGPTLVAELRERGDNTPIIMLTAESGPIIDAVIQQPGVIGYIVKPFKNEDIVPRVVDALAASGGQATG